MLFNLNEYVRVKLTQRGRNIHRQQWHAVMDGLRTKYEYHDPDEDKDGWSKWQGWDLMQTFGPHMGMGVDLPFELTIEIVEKDLK